MDADEMNAREYDELPQWMDVENMDDDQRAAYVAYCNSKPNTAEWLHYVYTYDVPTGCDGRERFYINGD